tara:strand:+ start:31048 stop:31287 length:240 start_codon:yes stop_codon:yes gene_type:complete
MNSEDRNDDNVPKEAVPAPKPKSKPKAKKAAPKSDVVKKIEAAGVDPALLKSAILKYEDGRFDEARIDECIEQVKKESE